MDQLVIYKNNTNTNNQFIWKTKIINGFIKKLLLCIWYIFSFHIAYKANTTKLCFCTQYFEITSKRWDIRQMKVIKPKIKWNLLAPNDQSTISQFMPFYVHVITQHLYNRSNVLISCIMQWISTVCWLYFTWVTEIGLGIWNSFHNISSSSLGDLLAHLCFKRPYKFHVQINLKCLSTACWPRRSQAAGS